MTWFWTALIATLCWGFADLFYKSGADPEDRRSHLKTTVAVGIFFGLHAAYTLLFGDIGFDWRNLIRYAPVSVMYILSMAIGYLGLRYLELSIVSPVENCSGALAALLGILILREMPESVFTWIGIACCCLGVFLLGLFERNRDAGRSPIRMGGSSAPAWGPSCCLWPTASSIPWAPSWMIPAWIWRAPGS